jgi:hypothetical protein
LIESTGIDIRTLAAAACACDKTLFSARFGWSGRGHAVCGFPFGAFTMPASSEFQTHAMR